MTLEKQTSQCPSNEKRHEEGGLKYDQLQSLGATEAFNGRRPLLPDNAPR